MEVSSTEMNHCVWVTDRKIYNTELKRIHMYGQELKEKQHAIVNAFHFLVEDYGLSDPKISWIGDPQSNARGFSVTYDSKEGFEIRVFVESCG